MSLYEEILKKNEKVSLVGLGYVGMPIAVAFSKQVEVIGFDVNAHKIELYKKGIDPTNEVGDEAIAKCTVEFTSDETKLREAKFHIVAVPTPVNSDHTPDLTPVEGASHVVGRNLTKGSIVVYESTVYPGVTEDICVPILEQESGLKCGVDFKIGYSPERINPGDKVHRLETIVKIVSGMDEETLEEVANEYSLVAKAGVHREESIKVAEAAKVIENSQRDINIAFMNELAKIFNAMDIDTNDVIEAASSKWNFIKLRPGLVGGHCISVDPYYLIQKAQVYGVLPRIMSSARRLNDGMGDYVANQVIKLMNKKGVLVKDSNILLLGITFKENCPDIRNTKVVDIYSTLLEYTKNISVYDPWANAEKVYEEYGIRMIDNVNEKKYDAIILAVGHNEFKTIDIKALGNDISVVFDVKCFLDRAIVDGRL